MSRGPLLVSVVAVALAAVACTSAGRPESSPASTPVTSPSAPAPVSSATPSDLATSASVPASVSSTASPVASPSAASATPTSSPPPPSATHIGPATCTAHQLAVSTVPGGAYQGREIAGIVFTNSSTRRCTIRGYPSMQLQHKGGALGRPATHDRGTVRAVLLRPGSAAQAQATAVTTCQSAISDHALVRAPGASTSADVVIELRGCALSIGPVEGA